MRLLQLLDLFLQLGDEGLLVLQLGGEGGDLLVLALDGLVEFLLVALEVGDGLLGELEVSLNLPAVLLDVGADLLLALQRVFQLVEGLPNFCLTLFRWLTLSSEAWSSSPVFWVFSPCIFFSLFNLLMSSSWWAISSFKLRIWWSLVALSCSDFWTLSSRSSTSFLRPETSCSNFFLAWNS